MWNKVKLWGGGISAFILAVASVATALLTIATAFPKILPFWAPFDAGLLVRDIRVEKVEPTDGKFGTSTSLPAARLHVEFIEEKSGSSTLEICRPELKLQDVYNAESWPARKRTLFGTRHERDFDTFVVKRDQYGKEGSLRVICDGRITEWRSFPLPIITGLNTPKKVNLTACVGEYRSACGGTGNFIPCGGNVEDWVKATYPAECVKVVSRKVSDVSGNRCGYATFEITCSSE